MWNYSGNIYCIYMVDLSIYTVCKIGLTSAEFQQYEQQNEERFCFSTTQHTLTQVLHGCFKKRQWLSLVLRLLPLLHAVVGNI